MYQDAEHDILLRFPLSRPGFQVMIRLKWKAKPALRHFFDAIFTDPHRVRFCKILSGIGKMLSNWLKNQYK